MIPLDRLLVPAGVAMELGELASVGGLLGTAEDTIESFHRILKLVPLSQGFAQFHDRLQGVAVIGTHLVQFFDPGQRIPMTLTLLKQGEHAPDQFAHPHAIRGGLGFALADPQ